MNLNFTCDMVASIILFLMSDSTLDSIYEQVVKKNSKVNDSIAVTYSSLKRSVRQLENSASDSKQAGEGNYMRVFERTMMAMLK